MLKRRFRKKTIDSNVDMTPMLDIVFIMLIFFIVTAVFIDEKGLDFTQAPDCLDCPSPPAGAISVYVYQDGTASVGGQLTDVQSVAARVQVLRAARPQALVLLGANRQAAHGHVVFLMDEFAKANIPASLKIRTADK